MFNYHSEVISPRGIQSFYVLSIAAVFIASASLEVCPKGCQCNEIEGLLNCNDYSIEDLNNYIDIHVNVKSITLSNSGITPRLWSSLCNLSSLVYFDVSYNNISVLPDGCFKHMKSLTIFKADFNEIIVLQNGLFDGLESIKLILLRNNKISHIEAHVFTNVSLFKNLEKIELQENQLTELDPWPLLLGMIGKVEIHLETNLINKPTNTINFHPQCDDSVEYQFQIKLEENKITHVSPFIQVWGSNDFVNSRCIYQASSLISLDENPIKCDCVDYIFIILRTKVIHTNYFNVQLCGPQESIMSKTQETIICEVTEMCPNDCRCIQRPSNKTVLVDCSDTSLKSVPLNLPSRKSLAVFYNHTFKYEIIFSPNSISEINNEHTILKHTVSLDVSHGRISVISDGAWEYMIKIVFIYLHNNQLSTLSRKVEQLNLSASIISLHENPWNCSCENAWMKKWLNTVKDRLVQKTILCYQPKWLAGKDIFKIADFCAEPPSTSTTDSNEFKIWIGVSVCVEFLLISLVILLLLWRKYKYQVFKKYGVRYLFDQDECLGEEMKFDVFLSSSEHDTLLAKEILKQLEHVYNFKVLYHSRDFIAGMEIMENIEEAINSSKRILCLVSNHFLTSFWCREEFRMAYHNDMKKSKHRLIVILLEDVDPSGSALFTEFKQYVANRTYIEKYNMSEEQMWNNLLYSLTKNKLGCVSEESHGESSDLTDSLMLEC